ncbi:MULTISPECIES: PadR family transcriptional regulator [Reichenbachiella]|nr:MULTISPECIES: PadR family transcriptional regulator [Reichenbachiella]MBU2915330.1 PadR family transcriptional regulator [Reichenbachiella agariperforans]RJE70552.1 PadR family transcriptional regulator [Reichenbachiella sp. MSK19-1]
MYSNELIKGTLKTIILKLLQDSGRMYGYEITQRVKSLTDDKINLTEGALYPTLHKLQAESLITSEQEIFNGRKRKYYSITETGQANATARAEEFISFTKTMFAIIKPQLTK